MLSVDPGTPTDSPNWQGFPFLPHIYQLRGSVVASNLQSLSIKASAALAEVYDRLLL